MRSSHDSLRDIRFCLDANISPRAAAGIDNVIHVSEVDALSRTHGGHSDAHDYDIAVERYVRIDQIRHQHQNDGDHDVELRQARDGTAE